MFFNVSFLHMRRIRDVIVDRELMRLIPKDPCPLSLTAAVGEHRVQESNKNRLGQAVATRELQDKGDVQIDKMK